MRQARARRRAVSDPIRSRDAYGARFSTDGMLKNRSIISKLLSYRGLHTAFVSRRWIISRARRQRLLEISRFAACTSPLTAIPATHRQGRPNRQVHRCARNIASHTARIREPRSGHALFPVMPGGRDSAGSEPGGALRSPRVKGKPGEGMTPRGRRKVFRPARPNPSHRRTFHVRSNLPFRRNPRRPVRSR